MPGNRVTVELKGLAELERALLALPKEVKASKIIYRALHDGARVIMPAIKQRVPILKNPSQEQRREPGAIRASITQHASKTEKFAVLIRVRSRGYIFGAGFDSRRNAKNPQRAGNANYWWLVEFGTSHAPAQPFLRPGFEEKKMAAATAVQLSLLRGVAYEAQRLGLKIEI